MNLHNATRHLLLVCTCLISFFYANANTVFSEVILFTDTNLKGEQFVLYDNWTHHEAEGVASPEVKSIYVPKGYEIWVYRGTNFQGEFRIFNESWDGTGKHDDRWRGEIRSVRIVRKPLAVTVKYIQPVVTLFQKEYFRGNEKYLKEDWAGGEKKWDNKISSISVPPGVKVILYDELSFKGESIILTENWEGGEEWDNRIGSVKVIYP